MKSNELRIGNIISSDDGIYRIYAISSQDILAIQGLLSKIGSEESVYSALNIVLSPIPLTEDILLKCSFSMKYGTDPQAQNALKVFSLENLEILKFELDKFFFFSTGKGLIHTNIKYLHQLQNLYFALTSQELEINL